MGSYRSAYEDYYKNINSKAKGKKDNKNHLSSGKKINNPIGSRYGSDMKSNNKITNILVKRVTKELTGTIILLLFFIGLKYIPSTQIQEMHITCKNMINKSFDYNEYIDTFSTMQIGNIQGKDLKIGGFTIDDLRIENLKSRTFDFIKYLKSNGNIQN